MNDCKIKTKTNIKTGDSFSVTSLGDLMPLAKLDKGTETTQNVNKVGTFQILFTKIHSGHPVQKAIQSVIKGNFDQKRLMQFFWMMIEARLGKCLAKMKRLWTF